MRIFFVIVLLCAFEACNAKSKCLLAAPSGSKLCYEAQNKGQHVADKIKSIDIIVVKTIYQSIEEGSMMLSSGMELLKKKVASVHISSSSQAPIEQSTIANLQARTEAVAKESVKTANKELHEEIKKALISLLDDSILSNNFINAIGFSAGQTVRKRRSAGDSSTDDGDFGNSIQGVVKSAIPAVNQTLVTADLKMKASFNAIFVAFTSSIKQLLGSSVGINFDEVELNMVNMITVAAKNLIESNVDYTRKLLAIILGDLYELAVLAQPYKNDAAKMSDILEPARVLLREAIAKTQSIAHDTALVQRIALAIARIKEYYEEIKKIVTT
eukprot:gene4616-5222_t